MIFLSSLFDDFFFFFSVKHDFSSVEILIYGYKNFLNLVKLRFEENVDRKISQALSRRLKKNTVHDQEMLCLFQ